jgi:thioredoxin reductase/pSer/pThr/pTyr-binding forkhead associated (FHA) protein/ferredoxin
MSVPTDRLADGTIVLDSPVALPEVLDLLIVGGGPVGTACAFHAKELGIRALVIESDDLMKRIRDYAKDKPILPDYGGGDTMPFPAGGDLVSALQFAPIDKDEMVVAWKGLYRRFSVPAKVGVELLSLSRQADGTWSAAARNHYTKKDETYRARNVVLGLGRGVPRRLDISGNVQDLAVRLTDAEQYVGAPACVIGGGTSAAEAAIAISNAKTASETDETPVYWSYRGKYLPKVSQALAPQLFEVFMMNGNLRLVLGSDPVGVVSRDGRDYLAICTRVSEGAGQPREIVHLEFEKAFCVACIGADRPDPLLKAVGAEFVPKESGDGDRLVVSQLLETRQPGVFLAGDLLSPDYAETDNFDGDPAGFTVRARRGNIKAALRDGVLLAQVVKQRLEGRQEIVVQIPAAPAPLERGRIAPAAEKPRSPGRLVALLADNTPADEFPLLWEGVTTIGRGNTTIPFPQDSMLSDQHASIAHGPAGLELSDLGSEHGVFLKVPEGRIVQLPSGTIVKAGRQWLVARESPAGAEVVQWDNQGAQVGRYPIPEGTTIVFGRRAPATILSADDQTLGRQHLSLSAESGRLLLRDLNSRNGTFVKIERRWKLQNGDLIWLGNQMLRVVLGEPQAEGPTLVTGAVRAATPPPPPAAPAPAAPRPAAAAAGEAAVTFTPPGKAFPAVKGKTLLDLAIAKRVRLKWECKVGDCGKCWVKVTSGGEHLNPRSAQEDKTLRMISHDLPQCRLACLVTEVRGPVAVDVPK